MRIWIGVGAVRLAPRVYYVERERVGIGEVEGGMGAWLPWLVLAVLQAPPFWASTSLKLLPFQATCCPCARNAESIRGGRRCGSSRRSYHAVLPVRFSLSLSLSPYYFSILIILFSFCFAIFYPTFLFTTTIFPFCPVDNFFFWKTLYRLAGETSLRIAVRWVLPFWQIYRNQIVLCAKIVSVQMPYVHAPLRRVHAGCSSLLIGDWSDPASVRGAYLLPALSSAQRENRERERWVNYVQPLLDCVNFCGP